MSSKSTLVAFAPLLIACGGVVDVGTEPSPEDNQQPTEPFTAELRQFVEWGRGMCASFSDDHVRCWEDARPECLIDVPGLGGISLGTAEAYSQNPGAICAVQASGRIACVRTECPYMEEPRHRHCGPVGEVFELPGIESAVSLGTGRLSIAILADGRVQLWNSGSFCDEVIPVEAPPGAIVDGAVPEWIRPPLELAEPIVKAHAGARACFVGESGHVYCGGQQFADSSGADRGCDWPPVALADIDDAVDVAGALDSTCILHRSGRVTCLGWARELGIGSARDEFARGEVVGIDDAISIGSSSSGTCALRSDQSLWCWGGSRYGMFGVTSSEAEGGIVLYTPIRVSPLGETRAFGLGPTNTCAVRGDNEVRCLGGQAPYGYYSNEPATTVPFQIPLH